MKGRVIAASAALLLLPGACSFGVDGVGPWWAEPFPEDASGFNCLGTVKHENGRVVETTGFKFNERELAPLTHPDAVCLQTGPVDGWYRQQFKRIHVRPGSVNPKTGKLFCGGVGEPCDAYGTRLCTLEGPGIISPCGTTTGRNGCAICGEVLPSKER